MSFNGQLQKLEEAAAGGRHHQALHVHRRKNDLEDPPPRFDELLKAAGKADLGSNHLVLARPCPF
jgi:hypothetical protein